MARGRRLGETPLFHAASEDDADRVRLLVEGGAAIDEVDGQGRTALFGAVDEGSVKAATALLDLGADRKAHDAALIPTAWEKPLANTGAQPSLLHLAAARDHAGIVELLVTRGLAVDQRDRDGVTPLGMACSAKANHALAALLAHGADPDVVDGGGHVPLELCSDVECVRLLLGAGASPEGNRDSPRSPLGRFAMAGDGECVRLLLHAGAAVERPSGEHTPLAWAARMGHAGVIDQLLEAGAAVDAHGSEGDGELTPLELAARFGHDAVAVRLLAAGAQATTPALQEAAAGGHVVLVRKLLDAGADLKAGDRQFGQTALHLAAKAGAADVVDLLLSAGAPREARDPEGRTPLWLAAAAGSEKACRALLSARADLSAAASDGRTPSKAAEDAGHPQLGWNLRPSSRPVPRPAAARAPRADEPPREGPLVVGDRVLHATFGRGVVKAVAGAGENGKVTVAFERLGTKVMLASFVARA
jgi:ankyrin repeat protein